MKIYFIFFVISFLNLAIGSDNRCSILFKKETFLPSEKINKIKNQNVEFLGLKNHLTSYRCQTFGTCWAYAGAHFVEAYAQINHNLKIEFSVDNNLMFWTLYERLYDVFISKKIFPKFNGVGIDTSMGSGMEFLKVFFKYGAPIKLFGDKVGKAKDFDFPNKTLISGGGGSMYGPYHDESTTYIKKDLETDWWKPSFRVDFDLVQQKIIETTNYEEFHSIVYEAVKLHFGKDPSEKTLWDNKEIYLTEVPKLIFGNNVSFDNFVYLSQQSYPNGQNFNELIRISLLNGWPVILNPINHYNITASYSTDEMGNDFLLFYDSNDNRPEWRSVEVFGRDPWKGLFNGAIFFHPAIKDLVGPLDDIAFNN